MGFWCVFHWRKPHVDLILSRVDGLSDFDFDFDNDNNNDNDNDNDNACRLLIMTMQCLLACLRPWPRRILLAVIVPPIIFEEKSGIVVTIPY